MWTEVKGNYRAMDILAMSLSRNRDTVVALFRCIDWRRAAAFSTVHEFGNVVERHRTENAFMAGLIQPAVEVSPIRKPLNLLLRRRLEHFYPR